MRRPDGVASAGPDVCARSIAAGPHPSEASSKITQREGRARTNASSNSITAFSIAGVNGVR